MGHSVSLPSDTLSGQQTMCPLLSCWLLQATIKGGGDTLSGHLKRGTVCPLLPCWLLQATSKGGGDILSGHLKRGTLKVTLCPLLYYWLRPGHTLMVHCMVANKLNPDLTQSESVLKSQRIEKRNQLHLFLIRNLHSFL